MRKSHLLAIAGAMLAGISLAAEELHPLTAVAVFDIKPGKEDAYLTLVRKHYSPMFEKLMSDGTVLGWGFDRTVFHKRKEPGHDAWFTVRDYAGMEKVFGMMDEIREKMSPEDHAAFASAVDFEQHFDLVLRDVFGKVKTVPNGTMPYTQISVMRAKPGMEMQLNEFTAKHIRPVLDKLFDEGAILGYSFSHEAQHTMGPGTRWGIVILPTLAANDKVEAAINAAFAEDSEALKEWHDITEPGHQDELLRALIFASK